MMIDARHITPQQTKVVPANKRERKGFRNGSKSLRKYSGPLG